MPRTALGLLGVLTLALSVGTAQAQTPTAPQPPPCPAALDKLNDALANAIIESQKCSQTTHGASECFKYENAVATYRTEIQRMCVSYSVPAGQCGCPPARRKR